MKVTYHPDSVTPFGGIHFVYELLSRYGIDRLINRELGPRAANSRYCYSDLIYGLLSIFLCGGDCAEDLAEHVGPYIDSEHLQIPSADTLLRIQRELASRLTRYLSRRGVSHLFNWNGPLARLNLRVLKHLGRLGAQESYTLDYDNVILPTQKADARRSYRGCYGYFPGVAMIGDQIVYVENRGAIANRCTNSIAPCAGSSGYSGNRGFGSNASGPTVAVTPERWSIGSPAAVIGFISRPEATSRS